MPQILLPMLLLPYWTIFETNSILIIADIILHVPTIQGNPVRRVQLPSADSTAQISLEQIKPCTDPDQWKRSHYPWWHTERKALFSNIRRSSVFSEKWSLTDFRSWMPLVQTVTEQINSTQNRGGLIIVSRTSQKWCTVYFSTISTRSMLIKELHPLRAHMTNVSTNVELSLFHLGHRTLFFYDLSVCERLIRPSLCAWLCLNFSFSFVKKLAHPFHNSPTCDAYETNTLLLYGIYTISYSGHSGLCRIHSERRNQLFFKRTGNSYWTVTKGRSTDKTFLIILFHTHVFHHSALSNKWYREQL